jgi:acetoin utilization deacetylase AcuC-like enzyme
VFNNAAIVAKKFIAATGGRVLIVDFDYHHGNGTEALVGDGISYVSTHASPAYPGTGMPDGNVLRKDGTLVDIPLPASGYPTEAFVALWAQTLHTAAQTVAPDLLVVSAGYDFVAGDPVGDLGIAPFASGHLGALMREIADGYTGGRAVFVLEGGYDPHVLGRCVEATIRGYDEAAAPQGLADRAAIPAPQRSILQRLGAA